MKTVKLDAGTALPALGLGTWRLGEVASRRRAEVASIRLAFEVGYRLIDTAEMYGEGGAERIIGEAIAEALRAGDLRRDELFIVSKVYPHNASREGAVAACKRSLERLGLDHIDMYLLHWRGAHPLAETVSAFEALASDGRIRHWGVSNLDLDDLRELQRVPSGERCATNQVWYSLGERGAEFSVLPEMRRRAMPLMAYSPIDQGALSGHPALAGIGRRHGASAAQVALAWVMAQPGVIAIPKAVREAHLRENFAATKLALEADDLAALDEAFPPPRGKTPLAML